MTTHIDAIRHSNLLRLIAEAGSADALARRSGTSSSYLSQIRSGREWAPGRVRQVGDRLAAKLEQAMDKPSGWMNTPPRPDPDVIPWHAGRDCPLISWEEAGSGGTPPSGEPEAHLHCPIECGPGTFALRVAGLSMAPRFRDGDYIFVDPDAAERNRGFVLVRPANGRGATFRQLVEEAGVRYLKALNRNWPNRIAEADDNAVCGVVVFHGHVV